jgi:hypothetical protein
MSASGTGCPPRETGFSQAFASFRRPQDLTQLQLPEELEEQSSLEGFILSPRFHLLGGCSCLYRLLFIPPIQHLVFSVAFFSLLHLLDHLTLPPCYWDLSFLLLDHSFPPGLGAPWLAWLPPLYYMMDIPRIFSFSFCCAMRRDEAI